MTKRAIPLVQANSADAEQQEAFNNWYIGIHIPQLLRKLAGQPDPTAQTLTGYI